MTAPDDPLLTSLGALPAPAPIDDLGAERTRRRAQSVLAAEKQLARYPWLLPVRSAWSRAMMPAVVIISSGTYLYWAVSAAGALYH